MMVKKSKASTTRHPPRKKVAPGSRGRRKQGKKHSITPKERWLLITENARARVQQRGFIGGNPIEDWLEAEREIDARYTTDYASIFSRTDASEIVEQIRGVFAGHRLSQLDLEDFIDQQRGGLKSLAQINRELIDGTTEFAAQQTALLQQSLGEAVKSLKSLAHGELDTGGVSKQAELSMQAMENVLSRVKSLANVVAKARPAKDKAAPKAKAATKTKTRAKTGTPARRRKTPAE
jgi:hypothetical protein